MPSFEEVGRECFAFGEFHGTRHTMEYEWDDDDMRGAVVASAEE